MEMSILVDTNVFLEILLVQDKKENCKSFLNKNRDRLVISDFSLHSIGVILLRKNKGELFEEFCTDILSRISILSLPVGIYSEIHSFSKKINLDFDDSYQALVAKEFNLRIATLDNDFKKVSKFIKVEFLK